MKLKKIFFVTLLLGISMYAYFSFQDREVQNLQGQEMLYGTIQSVEQKGVIQEVKVKITKGSIEGQEIKTEEDQSNILNRRGFEKGDKVMVEYNKEHNQFFISDFIRTDSILILCAILFILIALIAKWHGVGAVIGMMISFLVLFKMTLPMILSGYDPIMVAILSAVVIVPVTFYMAAGFNKKTHVAVIGTLLTLVIAGLLASVFASMANLTGMATEDAAFLQLNTVNKLNFRGLLLAGMLIGILGVLDDITIAQASVVQELHKSKPDMKKRELYARAMNVGKDHISSMVNTIVLIYTGSALPLLLLFFDYSEPLGQIINIEQISEEIIRTLIGSIGLVLAVPITTLIAVMVFKRDSKTR